MQAIFFPIAHQKLNMTVDSSMDCVDGHGLFLYSLSSRSPFQPQKRLFPSWCDPCDLITMQGRGEQITLFHQLSFADRVLWPGSLKGTAIFRGSRHLKTSAMSQPWESLWLLCLFYCPPPQATISTV